jgi:threonine/homoserine/homoserine lactone efflux protein
LSGNWGSVLLELIPLALVVALSPLSIIPAVLVLHTPRPRPTGLAFLAGWLVGLAALTSIFLEVSGLAGGLGGKPPGWASWLRVVVGVALVVFGGYRWLTRKKVAHSPKWMQSLSKLTPARAGAAGFALTIVNPKVLFISAAAGLAIGTTGLRGAQHWLAVLWYVAVAGSTVALPILAYAVSGDRLDAPLTRLKDWMDRQHAVLMAAILVVIGLLVLYKGIHGLGL